MDTRANLRRLSLTYAIRPLTIPPRTLASWALDRPLLDSWRPFVPATLASVDHEHMNIIILIRCQELFFSSCSLGRVILLRFDQGDDIPEQCLGAKWPFLLSIE